MFANRDTLARTGAHALALDCLQAGIEATHPRDVVREAVDIEGDDLVVGDRSVALEGIDRLLVVGGGNAAGRVATALEQILGGRIDDGVVVTDDPATCETVRVLDGDHPVPTERNVDHTRELLALARSATAEDLVVVAITGGGSALLAAPAAGVTLAEIQTTTDELIDSGASIGEINAVRKHLSAIKGGQLAEVLAPARVVGLVFSDVVGNDLSTIASGPTVPDETTYGDALAVLDRYDLAVPDSVRRHLRAGARGDGETPAGGPVFEAVEHHVLADGLTALEAAASEARRQGYDPLILSSRVRGEASEAAKTHVAIAEEIAASGHPIEPPAAVLSGGETTVTRPGEGIGGPNQEFGLSAALELQESDTVVGSVDTDGIDGSSRAAGCLVDAGTVTDRAAGRDALAAHDSFGFLDDRNAVLRTGPTGTNVNDLRVLVVPETAAAEGSTDTNH